MSDDQMDESTEKNNLNLQYPDRSDSMLTNIPDIDNYSQDTLKSMFLAIKSSNALPTPGDDFDFYNSFNGFRAVMKADGKNILSLMSKILKREGTKGQFENLDFEDHMDFLVDVNDSIIERINNACDEATGIKKKDEDLVMSTITDESKFITTSWNRKKSDSIKLNSIQLLSAKNIDRPQMKFKEKVDNSNTIFVPVIKDKPNSIKPLSIILEETQFGEEFSHPYEIEIEKFSPNEKHLSVNQPMFPKSLDDTPYKYINKREELEELGNILNQCDKFAVDLEAHSYRSFLSFTCLMQISTESADYIIDALECRSDLHILNESFTNPNIVKIFHGADNDIEWLQRDFGLYIVNLFDTYHASVLLNFSRHSLAYLLQHYCEVIANKQYQLADWRIRPLPDRMIHYAREDTHYLLYIYECMKKNLVDSGNIDKNLLKSTFSRSSLTCLKRYRKPMYDEQSHIILYKKSHKNFNARQMYALEGLYKWRNTVARAEDESTGYVLPNHMLLHICEVLPREQQGILALCNPIPPLVRQQLNEIHMTILQARQQSISSKVNVEQSEIVMVSPVRQVDTESLLHCPHDLSRAVDCNDMSTLINTVQDEDLNINRKESEFKSKVLIKKIPAFKVYKNENLSQKKIVENSDFISPYQRFKATSKDSIVPEMENSDGGAEEKSEKKVQDEEDSKCVVGDDSEKKDVDSTPLVPVEDEKVRPLRSKAKIPRKRKRKNTNMPEVSGSNNKNAKVQSNEGDEAKAFKAFDYGAVNYDKGGSSGKKFFNPDKSVSNIKGGGKSRVKQRHGQKSSHFNLEAGSKPRRSGRKI